MKIRALNTEFKCKLCAAKIVFNIEDDRTYLSKSSYQEFFGMHLATYRTAHVVGTERHSNTVLVDHKGLFRGLIDSFAEPIPNDKLVVDSVEFDEFKEQISEILSSEIIKPYYIVKTTGQIPTQSLSNEFWPIIANIDGKRTVTQIARKVNKDYQIVLEVLASFVSQNLIRFEIAIDTHDLPILTSKGTNFLFNATVEYQEIISEFGTGCLDVIKALNGKKTITRLVKDFDMSILDLKSLIRALLAKECVEIVPEELRSGIMIERLYEYVVHTLSSRLGNDKAIKLLSKAFGQSQNPWARLVRFDEKKISFKAVNTHIAGLKEFDLSQMLESLLIPVLVAFKAVEKVFGKKYSTEMKKEIINLIEEDFGHSDVGMINAILL